MNRFAFSINATCLLFFVTDAAAADTDKRLFQPSDMHRIQSVGDLAFSPDGKWLAYSVGTTNVEDDEKSSDLFMVSWDGATRIQLTHSEDSSESSPRFSPDGQYLAFIAARTDGQSDESDDPKTKSQVWMLNRSGGEASRISELPGGVSSFEWSPDSTRFVIVSRDPEEDESEEDDEPTHDTPKPIVVDRYRFKQDGIGYLGDRYQRLHVFDIDSRESFVLTPGPFDSTQPSWSPDGDRIAFSSKRDGDPDRHDNSDIYLIEAVEGAEPSRLTTWDGPDSSPKFSPDGKSIAYLQDGPPEFAGYDPSLIAVVSTDGGDPSFPARELDRAVSSVQWSEDGETLHFLLTDDRTRSVVSVPTRGGDVASLFSSDAQSGVVQEYVTVGNAVAVIASSGQSPAEIYRVDDGMALSDHNRELREEISWATVEGYDSTSKDGSRVGSILLKPPGFEAGTAYPTIAWIHGGPVSQDGFEFDATSQAFAAQGYLVVNPNYRGSNGRGKEFTRAIYADWGNLEIQDIHSVMDKLVADGLADPDRLGIGGWSYGGMNTNYAIASDTRFSAAVSGSGIANMLTGYGTDQYITQYENELGLPWESIEPYIKISYPFYQADRIKTPTLFMCGEKDFNVPVINSEQMYQALRSQNVPTQLVIYPGQYHGLSKPSYIQDRLERIIDWYQQHLGSPAR